jgi:pimeloyl-ACP methyl ester carboxylesterase
VAYIKQGQGPTLVLVHGTLIDFRYWTEQMDPFAERSRVIAVSLRHHYPNPSTDGQSDSGLRVHAADIAALIRTLAGPPVHLVGHSYGGFVALLVARDHPGLVRSLVLEEPALLNGLITNAQDQEAPMTRRLIGLLVTLVLGLLGAPLASDAQPLKEVPRIGVLAPWPRPPSFGIDAFQQGLRELGYVEGQHLTIEWRFTEGRDERAHDLATELVQLRVAVIVASTNAHVLAAQQATRTILIVFTTIFDLVARGLVASIARRGGNLTGIGEFSGVEMNSKRLELLLQAVPGVTRVAVLRYKNPAFAELPRSSVEVLQEAARALGVALQLLPVHQPDDLEGAFAAMARERAQALLLVPSALLYGTPNEALAHCGREPAAGDLLAPVFCGGRGVAGLWGKRAGRIPPRRGLCRQDPERCQARGPARGAAHQIRAGHQSQDRPGPRPHHPAHPALPGQRGDPLSRDARRPHDARCFADEIVHIRGADSRIHHSVNPSKTHAMFSNRTVDVLKSRQVRG